MKAEIMQNPDSIRILSDDLRFKKTNLWGKDGKCRIVLICYRNRKKVTAAKSGSSG